MAAKVEIIYEAEASSLKATINEVNKANDAIEASVKETSKVLSNSMKDVGKSFVNAFAGNEVRKALSDQNKSFEDLNKKTVPLTRVLRGLKNELNALEEAGKGGTAQFRQLTLEAARLEDQIGDTRARVANLASDTFKFDAAVQATQGLAAGFEIAQGAAALFGSESEDLQKALLKVQAATAIANGVQQIANLLLEESKIKTLALAAAQRVYAFVTTASTTATKAWRAALVSTGIGAIVVGLGFLIEKLFLTTEATEDATKATNDLAKAAQDAADKTAEAAVEQELAAIRLANAQGKISDEVAKRNEIETKTNEELRKNSVQTLNDLTEARQRYNDNIAALNEKFSGDERALLNAVIIEQRRFEGERQQLIQAGAARTTSIRQNSIAEIIEFENDLADKAEKANKKTQKAAKDTAKEYDSLKLSVGNVTAELIKQDTLLAEALSANRVSAAESSLARIRLLNEQGLASAEDVNNAEINLIQERAIAQIRSSELQQREKLQGVKEGSILETEIVSAGENERKAITDNAELEIFNKKKEFREKNAAERKKDREDEINELLEISQAAADVFGKIIELQGIQSQKRIDEINATSEAEKLAIEQSTQSEAEKQRQIENLRKRTEQKVAAEKKRQAAADKALAIFNTIINTAAAVMKAGGPLTPIGALTALAGIAQIAIISAQPIPKFKRGGMVGGQSHEAGGTLIEAERGEFVVNKDSVRRNRRELDAINTSSAAFKRLIEERYVRPAILNYAMNNKRDGITVNASLNSKSMERELKGLRKDMRNKNTIVNINGGDSRYSWQ
jgi:hypothetical protein